MKKYILEIAITIMAPFVTACSTDKPAEPSLTPVDARAIAREAFIYGFPMAANYLTMYLPGDTVVDGTWKKPQLQPVAK